MIKVLNIRLTCRVLVFIAFGLLCFSCDNTETTYSLQGEGALDFPKEPGKNKVPKDEINNQKPGPSDNTGQKPRPPSSPRPIVEKPASPKKNDEQAEEEVPFKKFLADPELQLWDKNSQELEKMALALKESVLKKNWQSIFRLLEIRIIQQDDRTANAIIKSFMVENLNEFVNLIKKAESKKKEIMGSIDVEKVTYKTQKYYTKINSILYAYTTLIGVIKGKADAIASIINITLPSDF